MDQHQVSINAQTFPLVSMAIIRTDGLLQESAVCDWYTTGSTSDPAGRLGFVIPWPIAPVKWTVTRMIVAGQLAPILMTTDNLARALQFADTGVGANADDLVINTQVQSSELSNTVSGLFQPKRYIAARYDKAGIANGQLTLESIGSAEVGPSTLKLASTGQSVAPVSLAS